MARPLRWLVAYLCVSGALYFLVTHVALGTVRLIQPSAIDAAVPILPATVPLYLSYLFVMPVLVWLGRARPWLLPAFFAGALATGICLVFHLFWPTEIVRPPADTGWLAWLHRIDSPLAASPSGHVALPVAITIVLAAQRQRVASVFAVWSIVLIPTVLTTGQHFLVDTLWGCVVGLLAGTVTFMLARSRVNLRSMAMILLEWLCIVVTLRIAFLLGNGWFDALAFVVIATRQHALFILYHDATHYHLTRRRSLNDFLINVAIGVPGTVPVEFYRPLHLAHHRHVGTALDPERRFLYQNQLWQFRPLDTVPLVRQLLGDALFINTLRTMRAYRAAGGKAPRPTTPLIAALLVWTAAGALLVWLCPVRTLIHLAVLWFGPLFTIGVLLQKLRSFAEHSGGPGATPGWLDWTYSWRVSWFGRIFVWPYHINLHLQHHRNPDVAWHALPEQMRDDDLTLPGKHLGGLLWARAARRNET
ncbi:MULTISPECIES: fatty acid desaturase [Paraburkholderia]|uniref:fatty acid desaturase n=1 Tax=Paraburkholderia TaxID=1822464 RepID=UPI00224F207E|nr:MULTISPECIES: fatty acid desaturase [Paraburkholderia]MCX4163901.1 fatty acid desaturase [Paraburkholderia megapolitana]MDN7159396.1 fatty acid desaturase [Paraburkholderia sp. CHISQ3]MDQ6496443.1 fatty acid desaturase [Paraburkholderia megapolitana]